MRVCPCPADMVNVMHATIRNVLMYIQIMMYAKKFALTDNLMEIIAYLRVNERFQSR